MTLFSHNYNASARRIPWSRIFRMAIAGLLLLVLYQQLFVRNDFSILWEGFRQNLSYRQSWKLVIVVLLMPVNLLLEAQKFRMLFEPMARPTLGHSVKSVLAGLVLGLMTPNRVGEYFGRLIDQQAKMRAVAFLSTVLGGLAQWTVMLLAGALAIFGLNALGRLSELFAHYPELASYAQFLAFAAAATGMLLLLVLAKARPLLEMLIRYISAQQKDQLSPIISARVGWRSRVEKFQSRLGLKTEWLQAGIDLSQAQVWKVLGLACLRYLVYIIQFSLSYQYFGLEIELFEIALGTALLLLIQSFIPLPSSLQALARIELALLVWAYADPNEVSMAVASMSIFVLNLALPALVGMVNLVQSNDQNAIRTT